jgi:transmembrane sensor
MNSNGEQRFHELLNGYLNESLSPKELEIFLELAAKPENALLLQQSFEKDLDAEPVDISNAEQAKDAWLRLSPKISTRRSSLGSKRITFFRVAAAACVLSIFGTLFFLKTRNQPDPLVNAQNLHLPAWLTPEHVGATLFLDGGDSVHLDNQNKGLIASQQGIQIFQQDGDISYSVSGNTPISQQVKTGRGKLYRVILPDQTIVWLNQESSIRYPVPFSGKSRTVEITGEVYFEVAHKTDQPFMVASAEQVTVDIGTSFNIDAVDQHTIKTTLIEGSVLVKSVGKEATLVRGEQAVVSSESKDILLVKNANTDMVLAWKNGFFYFQKTRLRNVMNQISQWYNFDVVYEGTESQELFNGQIDKSLSLTQVLKGLQQPGVTFSLNENRQIIVRQK